MNFAGQTIRPSWHGLRRFLRWAPLCAGVLGLIWVAVELDPGTRDFLAALSPVAVLVVIVAHLPALMTDALALNTLMAPQMRPRFRTAWFACWASQSVSRLLPVSQIGGEIAKVRLLTLGKVPLSAAITVTLAHATLSVATLIAFVAFGLAILRWVAPWVVPFAAIELAFAAVAVLMLLPLFGYRARTQALSRAADRLQQTFSLGALSRALQLPVQVRRFERVWADITADRRSFFISLGWHMLGWTICAIEIWITFLVLGHPIPFAQAVFLEAMIQLLRGAAFVIPGALGVQEAGILFLGMLLGIPQPAAFGFAVLRRARELVLSIGGLAAWQLAERHHAAS